MKLEKKIYKSILLLAAIFCLSEVAAQTRDQQIRGRVDSALTTRYFKTSYDTSYVVRPEGSLTLKLRVNQTGNDFHAKGTVNGDKSKADLHTSHKTTMSIGVSYRGISASLAINPAKMKGIYKDYELNLNYYSNRITLDFSYQRSKTLAGDTYRGDNLQPLESGDITMKLVNLAGYYIFNNRKFSYSAPFTQSFIQRRSAGSWLAGISYQGGSIKTSEELKAKNPDAPDVRIELNNIGIGGGYGYNWVIGKQWLVHFSMFPAFVVYNHNNFTVNGERKAAKSMRFNMLFNERAAIVCNFSPRRFAGVTLTMNNSVFDDDLVVVNQNKWQARAFFGMRL